MTKRLLVSGRYGEGRLSWRGLLLLLRVGEFVLQVRAHFQRLAGVGRNQALELGQVQEAVRSGRRRSLLSSSVPVRGDVA